MNNWIDTMARGSDVGRWHTDGQLNQTVAHHSWRCALLAEHWAGYCDHVDRTRVMLHMLLHDVPESHMGDMPWGAKQDPEVMRALAHREVQVVNQHFPLRHVAIFARTGFANGEHHLVDLVDQAEALMFITQQVNRGRRDLMNTRANILDVVLSHVEKLRAVEPWAADRILDDIHQSTQLL